MVHPFSCRMWMLVVAAFSLVASLATAATTATPPTITLEKAVHFTADQTAIQEYQVFQTAGKPGPTRLYTPTRPGELVITEIMVDPSRVLDTAGEWFELFNATKSDLELQGLVVTNEGTERFRISQSMVIPAGGFLIFGNNGDPKSNGGVPVAFVYTGFTLANTGGAIVIQNGATIIDSVRYDAKAFRLMSGRAASLDPRAFNATANDIGTNWCPATQLMPGGDYGTPGFMNPNCM